MWCLKTLCMVIIMVILSVKVHGQQTIQFSQYVFNGLAVNPAYAGYKDDPTMNLSSRIQWVGINNAPQTSTASIDGLTNTENKNVGIGLLATVDQLGPENSTSVYANYAYRLRLDAEDTKRICFGIGAGITQYSLDGSKFNAIDAGDGSVPAGTVSKLTPDFRFGVYYYSPSVYFGASVFNLLSAAGINATDNTQIVKPVRTIYLTGGTLLPLSAFIDLKPSLLIKEDFKGPTNLDITNYVLVDKRVWLGASYRTAVALWNKSNLQSGLDNNDAVAAIVRFNVSDHFAVGYSYDFTVSKLANYQSGSHEVSVSISFPGKKPRIVSPRYF